MKSTLGIGLMPPIISRFLQKYPNTHIELQTLSTHQLADYLHQDLLDLALTTGELNEQDFRPVVINKTEAVCVMPRSHKLKDVRTVEFTMLKGESILSISETDELTIRIKAQLLKHGLPDTFAVQTPSSITVCALSPLARDRHCHPVYRQYLRRPTTNKPPETSARHRRPDGHAGADRALFTDPAFH